MTDSVRCAVRELVRRPGRSLAAMSGYLLGSAFVFALAILLKTDLQAKSSIVNYMGTHFVAFSPAPYADDAFANNDQRPVDPLNEAFFAEPMVVTSLLPKSLAGKIAELPEVLAATPFLLFRFKQGQDGHVFSVGGLESGDIAALRGTAATSRDIISGAFLQPGDRGVVLVEETYALMWNLKVGSVVNIADTLFPVIGVVRPGVRPVRADILMNWADAEAAINKRLATPLQQQANLFLVESAGLHNHELAMKKVEQLMPDGMINTFNCSGPAIEVMGISAKTLRLLTIIVFCIVLVFAANSQWASVVERQRDIAILRALGWKNGSILLQVVVEALLLAAIGTVTGIFFGYAVARFFHPAISTNLSAGSLLFFDWLTILGTLVAFCSA
ncbi:MAG: hypothetical protein ACD_39C00618G0003, partial [uncultured bacterium]